MTISGASSAPTPTASSRISPVAGSSWLPSRLETDLIALVREGLRRVGAVTITVSGSSMLPTLRAGQRVVLHRPEPAALRPGAVVAFRGRDGHLVLHRVRATTTQTLITAGDNETLLDPPVPPAEVVGVLADPPPAPDPLRWTPGEPRAAGPVEVWVVDDETAVAGDLPLPTGWAAHRRNRVGVGVSDRTLAELRARARDRPCVAVTEHAVHAAADVLPSPLPPATLVLVGVSLGRLAKAMPGNLVPPELAHAHVRVGPPGVPVGPELAVARLAAATGARS